MSKNTLKSLQDIYDEIEYGERKFKESMDTGKTTGRLKEFNPITNDTCDDVDTQFNGEIKDLPTPTELPSFLERANFFLDEALPQYTDHMKSASLKQIGGNHYKDLKIQPMEFCLANKLDFATSNAIKYLVRRKGDSKKRVEDLRKSIHCIEILLEFEERNQHEKD